MEGECGLSIGEHREDRGRKEAWGLYFPSLASPFMRIGDVFQCDTWMY